MLQYHEDHVIVILHLGALSEIYHVFHGQRMELKQIGQALQNRQITQTDDVHPGNSGFGASIGQLLGELIQVLDCHVVDTRAAIFQQMYASLLIFAGRRHQYARRRAGRLIIFA